MVDEIDKKIISILQKNARTSNADIAKSVGLVPSAVLERVRKLEKRNVIQGYEARVSPKSMDLGMTSFVWVDSNEKVGSVRVGEELAELPEIQEVHYMTGENYYFLKVRVRDTDEQTRLIEKMGEIDGIVSVRTVLVLKTVKETLELGIK
jgi:Lrp/AsnC family transcriptional regulator, leucine-responsive regulatory protein